MKKPKITKGPWHAVEYSGYMIIQDEDHYGGLNVLDKNHFPLAENNAVAVTAVPEMIDSLIEARQDLMDWNKGIRSELTEKVIEQIETALRKAGAIDEEEG